jgi:hypothetical protein
MKLLVEIWHSAVSRAQQVGGNWLIVIQKEAEELIRGWLSKTGGTIPPFIQLGHHNSLAGIDRYRDVRGLIVIGRALPPPSEVERIAGVLTGKAVPACGAWYPAEMPTLATRDGSTERDTGTIPYKNYLYGNVFILRFSTGALKAGTYRRSTAQRHRDERVVYDPRMVPDIEAWLTEHLGPLAYFEPMPAETGVDTAGTVDGQSAPAPDQVQDQPLTPSILAEATELFAEERPCPTTAAPAKKYPAPAAPPSLFDQPAQFELFFDICLQSERDRLPEWTGGIAPPPIRQAMQRELWRRGNRHRDLAGAVGLSRPQVTNLLRGRFGTTPANADALKLLLDMWRAA